MHRDYLLFLVIRCHTCWGTYRDKIKTLFIGSMSRRQAFVWAGFPSRLALAQQLSYSLFLPVIPTRLRHTLLQEIGP